ncbi:MAG: serine/threonine protein kinase, partial [Planctomycetes bacterium]|nr:serine/threonine protein kinase [Planctomycetota bacterium]
DAAPWMRAAFPQTLWVLVLPVLTAAVWQLSVRLSLSLPAVEVVDVGFVAAFAVVFAVIAWSEGEILQAITPTTSFLLLRSALIPTSGLRTGVLSAVACVVVLGAGFLAGESCLSVGLLGLRLTVLVAIATTISQVIYSLRRQIGHTEDLSQYRLEKKIADGEMGAIYKARHRLLHRPTAVKLIRSQGQDEDLIARFEREVRLTSSLTNPHTVAIYDYGHTEDGAFYYAMEYLPGTTLRDLVKRTGPQPASRVIHILRQVCASLYEAHAAGLIHRDINPDNIILCERGHVYDVVKVVGFGLAKRIVDSQGRPQRGVEPPSAGAVLGTPHYLSPEAINSPDDVDSQSDLYSLGVVAYVLLTGTTPFKGGDFVEIAMHQMNTVPQRPSERLGESVPNDLEDLILSCLRKNPASRPADAGALRRALAGCRESGAWTQMRARAWWQEHGDVFE